MLKKIVVFLCLFSCFQFLVFSATTTRSGSGSVPEMAFRSWRVGRSPMGTDTSSEVQKSFITTSETECWVSVSVGYKGGTLPRGSASPIDPSTVEWEFSDLRKGWAEAEAPGTSWSGLHPSKLSGRTSFNVLAKFSLPKYNDRTHYTISASCSANDNNRRSRSPKHRSGENMKITVTFKAKTYSGQAITPLVLRLVQDERDQLRQEYLDLTRKIPSRGSIKDVDGNFNNFGKVFYDFGHYDVMLYEKLKDKHEDWKDEANTLFRKNKTQLTQSDLEVTSAFRNPHHNDHHARKTTRRATDTFHGLHQYGLALDISGSEFDIDDDGSFGDQDKMIRAAVAAGSTKQFKYTDTGHVHADWRGTGWPPSSPIPSIETPTLPPQSTDAPLVAPDNNAPAADAGCGHSPVHEKETMSGCNHEDYSCKWKVHYTTLICPPSPSGEKCTIHLDNKPGGVYRGLYRACQPHEHVYPSDDTTQDSSDQNRQRQPTETQTSPRQSQQPSDTTTQNPTQQPTDPNSQVTSPCKHTHPSSESALHVEVAFDCGTHKYWKCKVTPSSSEMNHHQTQTLPCGNHTGRPCSVASSHLTPVSCPTKNGKACNYGSYYTCTQHVHAYPGETTVQVQYRRCGDPTTDSGDHSWVSSCSVSNSQGVSCTRTDGYWACRPHVHKYGSSPPPPSYHGCRRHLSSEGGDHSWVASCTVSNGSGESCTKTTGYWACTPHVHTYPDTPPPPELRRCGRHYKSEGGDHSWIASCTVTNSSGASCTKASGYFACSPHVHTYPTLRRCGRHYKSEGGDHSWIASCSVTNARGDTCTKVNGYFACSPHIHTYPTLRRCGRHYKSVGGDHSWVSSCSVTNSRGASCTKASGYFACSPHTHKFPAAPATRPCGHLVSASGSHSWVSSCRVSNANGRCTNTSGYYACTPHSHKFPSPPSTTLGPCGNHQITASERSAHSSVSFACGSHSYYRCAGPDAREHLYHASRTCPKDSHGQACTQGTYYMCVSHTHSYPSPPPSSVKCGNSWTGRGACATGRVITGSDPDEHRITCGGSHSIWGCNIGALEHHVQLHSCKRPGCGVSTTKCQNGNGGCFSGGREYKWHSF